MLSETLLQRLALQQKEQEAAELRHQVCHSCLFYFVTLTHTLKAHVAAEGARGNCPCIPGILSEHIHSTTLRQMSKAPAGAMGAAESDSRGMSLDDFPYIVSFFVQFMLLQQRQQEAANLECKVCYFKNSCCSALVYDICSSSYRDLSESRRWLTWSSGYVIWVYLFHNAVTEDANSANSKYKWMTSITRYVTQRPSFLCATKGSPPRSNRNRQLPMRNVRYGSQVHVTYDNELNLRG